MRVDYSVEEENNRSYNYSMNLSSGDAFVVSSDVKGFRYSVEQVMTATLPQGLFMREGSLFISVERD